MLGTCILLYLQGAIIMKPNILRKPEQIMNCWMNQDPEIIKAETIKVAAHKRGRKNPCEKSANDA